MVSPSIIKFIYVLGFLAITIVGILVMVGGPIVGGLMNENYGNGAGVIAGIVGGLLVIIVGNLIWRVMCEAWILAFSIHEILGSAEKALKEKLAP
jgi:Na+/proline symporter